MQVWDENDGFLDALLCPFANIDAKKLTSIASGLEADETKQEVLESIDLDQIEFDYNCIRGLLATFPDLKRQILTRKDIGLSSVLLFLKLVDFHQVEDLFHATAISLMAKPINTTLTYALLKAIFINVAQIGSD